MLRRFMFDEGELRSPAPGAPVARTVVGSNGGWPMGVVQVTVARGGGMPAHDHGGSATLLVSQVGSVRVTDAEDAEQSVEASPGSVVTIPADQRVVLENSGDVEARLLVVLTPPDFADQVASWPQLEESAVAG